MARGIGNAPPVSDLGTLDGGQYYKDSLAVGQVSAVLTVNFAGVIGDRVLFPFGASPGGHLSAGPFLEFLVFPGQITANDVGSVTLQIVEYIGAITVAKSVLVPAVLCPVGLYTRVGYKGAGGIVNAQITNTSPQAVELWFDVYARTKG